ncbi:MAG: RlmE family RNA methyltransferase [SAR86 cluster bacterium]|uniref:Ribosomal RNA large subunit methyltransferase E n=1 Tax=SAR86 cluster bacterium TaxID=2030880 RepID=A0A973A868_9GAMM|nr:RlmE family RNA methyltransferase [SAR86 cluster bacterium]
MKKSKSSHQWLKNHEDDEYVKRARAEGYRSRASYKLLEIDARFNLLKPGATVIDLGAAPGGWCQVVIEKIGSQGTLIGIDLLEMEPIPGVTFIQGDFTEAEPFEQLLASLDGRPVDLVFSDMAPNLSGVKNIDQPRAAHLVELSIDFADQVLRPGGGLVCKCFEGDGIQEIRQQYRARYGAVVNFKPKASRDKSRELYLVGQSFSGKSVSRIENR